MAETEYKWTHHDYLVYFHNTVALYRPDKNTTIPVLIYKKKNPAGFGSMSEQERDDSPITRVYGMDLNGKKTLYNFDKLLFKKFPGITYQTDISAGYISYKPGGYKKGPSKYEYALSDVLTNSTKYNSSSLMKISEYMESLQSTYLFSIVNRKRIFNIDDFQDVLDEKRMGCIVDHNYYLGHTRHGLCLLYKNSIIGTFSNKMLYIKAINSTIERLAKRVNYGIKCL